MADKTTSAGAAPAPSKEKDPHLPPLHRVGNLIAPKAPQEIATTGLEPRILADMMVKWGFTETRFTTDWVSQRLHISPLLARKVLERVCMDGTMEQLWETGEGGHHYRITDQGRQQASRLLEICGYIGPAPVSLESYAAMLRWQFANMRPVKQENVVAALSGLVLTPKAAELAGLAVSSGRSLFLFGPPGNGKSSVGRKLHSALPGGYWIPYAISVGNDVVRLFDDQTHERLKSDDDQSASIDQRWVRIRRPLVVVGGELTLESLDLIYSPALHQYEAPPHLKANGGVFLVDDFGRERVSPDQLLNRFITPMEYQIDYFTLRTGRKIQLPLRHVLIIATNLSPEVVTDPAFLRRLGYRVYLGTPTPEQFTQIFQNYANGRGLAVTPELIAKLLERYRAQNREPRSCEPRDLIERACDICRFQGKPLELTPDVLDLAWLGYFGE
ncbi:MAG: ATP-binding protein [Isosphaeraceae bacterium]